MINKLKRRLADYSFQKELKRNKIDRRFVKLDEVKSIGVLFDGSEEQNFPAYKRFVERMQQKNKKVDVLVYYGKKDKGDSPIHQLGLKYFSKKSLNWLKIPQGEEVKKFLSLKHDLLLYISPSDCYPLFYIAGLSKALCRVGRYSPESARYFDLMITFDHQNKLKEYLEQLEKLISNINSD